MTSDLSVLCKLSLIPCLSSWGSGGMRTANIIQAIGVQVDLANLSSFVIVSPEEPIT